MIEKDGNKNGKCLERGSWRVICLAYRLEEWRRRWAATMTDWLSHPLMAVLPLFAFSSLPGIEMQWKSEHEEGTALLEEYKKHRKQSCYAEVHAADSQWMKTVEQHNLRLSAFSMILVIAHVWISQNFLHRMRRAAALLGTNVRGRWGGMAVVNANCDEALTKDSTTHCYKAKLLWKPDWVGSFKEWQWGLDLTCEGY